MDMTPQEYQNYVKRMMPPSPMGKNTLFAFLVGGGICALGQLLLEGYLALGMEKAEASTLTSVTLVFLSALATGLNVYNSLARYAGAGTLVPITGFANAMVSPAIDFKAENWFNGVGAKMFTIAGPVIVYGVGASVVYGVFLMLFGGK